MSRFLALSFVTKLPGRGGGLNWWDVKPSGDYEEEWHQGELLALEALSHMAKTEDLPRGHLLGSLGISMPRRGEHTGVELGFLNCIGEFAAEGRRAFGDHGYRRYMAKRAAGAKRAIAEAQQERSEHARKAARARWAKARELQETG